MVANPEEAIEVDEVVASFAKPLPDTAPPREVKIVVNNSSSSNVLLDVTWTDLDFVAVAPHDARLGLLHMNPQQSICPCLCGADPRCPHCEKPPYRNVELQPGESHEVLWNGLLGRWTVEPDGDTCSAVFCPASGTYTVKVCDRGGAICDLIEVDLSRQETLQFDLEDEHSAAPVCPLEGDLAQRISWYHLVRMQLYGILPMERMNACDPDEVVCVPPTQRESRLEKHGDDPCSLLVVPGSDSIEVLAYLTSAGTDSGGEQWSMFVDADGTKIVRVAYGIKTAQ